MDILDFFNALFADIGSLLADIIAAIQALLVLLVNVFVFVWNGVTILAKYALKALVSGLKFFKHIWENGLKPLFAKVADIIGKLHKWLEDHLRPIINWLKKAQAWMERHVWQPLRQYIQFLQRIRRYLTILRLLHVKWAEKLDQRLARTEAELAHTFLLVRGYFNQVISWVNAASDPLRLGRMILFAAAGRRAAGALCRIFTGLPLGAFFPHTGKGSQLWERPLMKVQDLRDPSRNPPASDIVLGLSALPVDGFDTSDPTPSDADLDSLETVPFFDDQSAWWFASAAIFDSMDSPRISITDTISEQKGQLYDAGKVLRDWLGSAVEV